MYKIYREQIISKKDEIRQYIMENIDEHEDKKLFSHFPRAVVTEEGLEKYGSKIYTIFGQVMVQMQSKFHAYEGYDVYQEMIKLLEKYSFLEGNCCEIGAGVYPRLAELAIPKIKLNHGSLTVYEPEILFSNIENVTIVKEKISKNTNMEGFDTLFGLYPCDATITMAEKAFKEDKNLMIAFCSCDHSTKEHPKWIGDYWAEDFCMDYKEKYGEEVEIINWPDYMEFPLPIMVRRSSKHKEKIK